MNSIEALQVELGEVKDKLKKCFELEGKATGDQKNQLRNLYTKLQSRRDRLVVAIDIVSGRDYILHDIDGQLTVERPSEGTAKLIKVAEEYGAKVKKEVRSGSI